MPRPVETPVVREGTATLSTEWVTETYGNPIGRTFTFEIMDDGTIYTYSGVPCVVDGAATHFRFDDAELVHTRPAEEDER